MSRPRSASPALRAARRTLSVGLAATAAAVLVAGCSAGVPGAVTSGGPTSGSTSTATAAAPSSSPTPTQDAMLTAALPGADVLPTTATWTADPAETLEKIVLPNADTSPDECGLVTNMAVWSRIGGDPTGQAYASFSDDSSPAHAAAVLIDSYPDPLDTTLLTALEQLPDSCSSFSTEMNGSEATGSVADLDVPKLGDESAAATIFVQGNGSVFVTQVQVIAVGDDLVTVLQSTILDPTGDPSVPSSDPVSALAAATVSALGGSAG